MKLREYDVSVINFGFFRLDGGAMFGSVPKNLWGKLIPVDDENCIPLAARCLFIEGGGRKILVDVGLGEKWNDKQRRIFGIENTPESEWGFRREEITDVILTHLHFDHGGGITRPSAHEEGALELSFPNARIHVHESNLRNARNPGLRERASYLKENVAPLDTGTVVALTGERPVEILPGIIGHPCNGHTRGQLWIEVKGDDAPLFFATDLIPTSRHLPLPYSMGYDICTETLIGEKEAFLTRAVAERAVVVFEHDPDTAAARVTLRDKGHYGVLEVIPVD